MGRKIYSLNQIKYWYSYDQEEICALLKVHIQTIRGWIKDGLQINKQPSTTLIYGNELKKYLGKLNQSKKCPFGRLDRMLCMSCKDARELFQKKISLKHENKMLKATAICSDRECRKEMFRNYKLTDLPELRKIFYVVDVLELYDSRNPSLKTHFLHQDQDGKNEPDNDPIQRDLFGGLSG